MMFQIVRDYPQPPALVWRAVTDPELVARWTVTGQGGRPVGFVPIVGCKFQLIAKPLPGWRGKVDCEVIEVDEPRLLRYTWQGDEHETPTVVSYQVEPRGDGTRFTFEHKGFAGIGGFFMAKILRGVRRKMLDVGLPAVLDDLDKGAPEAKADGTR
jgi:uncharacterized protein YndB with AHSA1/START domain